MDRNCKVLVIDDSPFIFKAVKRSLEPLGYEVVANAPNGSEGLELYDKYNPDIVTLDVTMPVMSGLETAEALFKKYPNAKIIMLSAMGDKDLLDQARALGVKSFLSKPFDQETLVNAINELLNNGGE